MKLRCFYCNKEVSTEVPKGTIVRAILECPECIEKNESDDTENVINDLSKTEPMLHHCMSLWKKRIFSWSELLAYAIKLLVQRNKELSEMNLKLLQNSSSPSFELEVSKRNE